DRRGLPSFIVVITDREDQVWVPTLDQGRDVVFRAAGQAVIADHGEAGRGGNSALFKRFHPQQSFPPAGPTILGAKSMEQRKQLPHPGTPFQSGVKSQKKLASDF